MLVVGKSLHWFLKAGCWLPTSPSCTVLELSNDVRYWSLLKHKKTRAQIVNDILRFPFYSDLHEIMNSMRGKQIPPLSIHYNYCNHFTSLHFISTAG